MVPLPAIAERESNDCHLPNQRRIGRKIVPIHPYGREVFKKSKRQRKNNGLLQKNFTAQIDLSQYVLKFLPQREFHAYWTIRQPPLRIKAFFPCWR
jgi:hypothetical protein